MRNALVFSGLFAVVIAANAQPPSHGRVIDAREFSDVLAPETRAAIDAMIEENTTALRRAGIPIPSESATTVADLQWPIQPVGPLDQFDYHGVSNFVDHDARFPGSVQDYMCDTRTYDLASGYNHAGTDYFLWPYPWLMMDQGAFHIVAAASGLIVAKADGNFDRDCAIASTTDPNFVSVKQDDGFTATYLHMRKGSVTSAPIGTRVAAGDYLGTVGSSGQSSGPHLHFELRDAVGNVVDPLHGQCNAAPDRWAVFQPYENVRIDTLTTHAIEPVTIACGFASGTAVDEEPNENRVFAPGDTLWVFASYSDHRNGEVTNFSIARPDGSLFKQWDFDLASQNLPNPFYAGTAWDWQYTLPQNAPVGTWVVKAELAGHSYERAFFVSETYRDFNLENAAQARKQVGENAARCRPHGGDPIAGCP